MTKKVYLIDANSFIYRMFFWMPEFTTKDWKVVNAIFGIARFFLEQLIKEKPDYILFIKDAKWENFRHKLDKNYKATREKMPDNLVSQIPIIEEMVKKMWVPIIEIPWVEADDVVGTLAKKLENLTSPLEKGKKNMYEIYILSWDKDLYSLVSENVKIYDTMKKKKFWIKETIEKFWIKPEMIIDYLAIVWDKSDNIPWIEWFWPKKAVDLINIIWTIEDIYNFIEKNNFKNISDKEKKEILEKNFWEENAKKLFSIFKWKTFEKLLNSKENAFLSKKLATIKLDVKLDNFNLENYKFNPKKLLNPEIEELFKKLEFNSLLKEEKQIRKLWEDLWINVKIIDNDKKLEELLKKINSSIISFNKKDEDKKIVLDTETTYLEIEKAKLVWISIYLDKKNIFYINRKHPWNKVSDEKLKKFLEKLFKLNILIIGHNIKYDLEIIDLFLKKDNIKNPSNEKKEQISLF